MSSSLITSTSLSVPPQFLRRRRHPPLFPAALPLSSHPAALRRFSPQESSSAVVVVPDSRVWVGDRIAVEDEDDDDDVDDDDDRSLDLLVKFLHNVFRKISRRARKAARSVLPPSISTKLVAFSVNGVLILAFLWILKALLEVVCTLGSMVFVSILLLRGILSGVSYLQERQYNYASRIENDDSRWGGLKVA